MPASQATPDAVVTDVVRESLASPTGGAAVTKGNDSAASPERAAPRRPQFTRRRASDSPFIAVGLSEYLRVAQTLASRIVTSRSAQPTTTETSADDTDNAALHDTLTRWGMNSSVWLAMLDQLDRQCTRASGTAERVLQRAQAGAQQRFHAHEPLPRTVCPGAVRCVHVT